MLRDIALDALARMGNVHRVTTEREVYEIEPEGEWRRFMPGNRLTVVIEGDAMGHGCGAVDGNGD